MSVSSEIWVIWKRKAFSSILLSDRGKLLRPTLPVRYTQRTYLAHYRSERLVGESENDEIYIIIKHRWNKCEGKLTQRYNRTSKIAEHEKVPCRRFVDINNNNITSGVGGGNEKKICAAKNLFFFFFCKFPLTVLETWNSNHRASSWRCRGKREFRSLKSSLSYILLYSPSKNNRLSYFSSHKSLLTVIVGMKE